MAFPAPRWDYPGILTFDTRTTFLFSITTFFVVAGILPVANPPASPEDGMASLARSGLPAATPRIPADLDFHPAGRSHIPDARWKAASAIS